MTLTATVSNNNTVNPSVDVTQGGLNINGNYRGTLGAKDLQKIQSRYPKYLELAAETGVPWKVIASMDCAVTDFVGLKKLAQGIQESAKKAGVDFSKGFSESDAAKVMSQIKDKLKPGEQKYLDAALRFFHEINAAFK